MTDGEQSEGEMDGLMLDPPTDARLDGLAREVMEAEWAWERAWRNKMQPRMEKGALPAAVAAYDAATTRIARARTAWNEERARVGTVSSVSVDSVNFSLSPHP